MLVKFEGLLEVSEADVEKLKSLNIETLFLDNCPEIHSVAGVKVIPVQESETAIIAGDNEVYLFVIKEILQRTIKVDPKRFPQVKNGSDAAKLVSDLYYESEDVNIGPDPYDDIAETEVKMKEIVKCEQAEFYDDLFDLVGPAK